MINTFSTCVFGLFNSSHPALSQLESYLHSYFFSVGVGDFGHTFSQISSDTSQSVQRIIATGRSFSFHEHQILESYKNRDLKLIYENESPQRNQFCEVDKTRSHF